MSFVPRRKYSERALSNLKIKIKYINTHPEYSNVTDLKQYPKTSIFTSYSHVNGLSYGLYDYKIEIEVSYLIYFWMLLH